MNATNRQTDEPSTALHIRPLPLAIDAMWPKKQKKSRHKMLHNTDITKSNLSSELRYFQIKKSVTYHTSE